MKQALILLHILLLTLLAYASVDLFYKPLAVNPEPQEKGPEISHALLAQTEPGVNMASDQKKHEAILSRNLFHVLRQPPNTGGLSKKETPVLTDLKPTQLKLALWGTVTGADDGQAWAVIENRKEKTQALFQTGDVVADATIKKIMRNKVILTYQNQDQVLEVDPSLTPPGITVQPVVKDATPLIHDITNSAAQNAGTTLYAMKQVRIRPFFRQGDPQGLLLYGIKPDSPFQKMGFKNGDIVQEINGASTLSAPDARVIYQSATAQSDTQMVILRRGKKMEIIYHPSDNTFTTEAAQNE